MVFQFITSDGKEKSVGKPVESKPGQAFVRGTVEGGLGSYGNLLSLIPGYQPGRSLPSQQARTQLEANATPEQLPGLVGSDELAPEYGTLPTSEQVSRFLDMLGIRKKEETSQEQGLGKLGRYFGGGLSVPGVGAGTALSTAYTAAGVGELAKALGANEKIQHGLEFLSSLRGGKPAQRQSTAIRQPRLVERGIPPSEAGFISPERMTQQLNRVGNEAAQIASTVGKESPTFQTIGKAIERSVPIKKKFNDVFDTLENTAKEFNPEINTSSLDNFLTKEAERFAKTGAPTELGRFITNEVQGWQQHGAPNLYNAYRRYRLNNERVREIIDAVPRFTKLSDLDRQKISFLSRMNESIVDSFKNSMSSNVPALPGQTGQQTAQWLKIFEESNRAYSNYLSTQTAKRILDPIMQKNVTDKQLSNFLQNQRNWDDLGRFLGADESKKLQTLVQDVITARDSIKAMARKEVGAEVAKHALTAVIPGFGKLAGFLSIPKIWQWARGRYHSAPSFQENFHELTQALVEKNVPAIRKGIEDLRSEEKGEPKQKKSFFVQ